MLEKDDVVEKAVKPETIYTVLVRLDYQRPQVVYRALNAKVDDGTLAIELEDGGVAIYATGHWHTVTSFPIVEGDDPCPRCCAVGKWDADITARRCSMCGKSKEVKSGDA